jgi:hypothetical protein
MAMLDSQRVSPRLGDIQIWIELRTAMVRQNDRQMGVDWSASDAGMPRRRNVLISDGANLRDFHGSPQVLQ